MNHEGYRDPTAEKAIHNTERIPRRVMDVIRLLRQIAGLAGLEITRLQLRDRHTKQKYEEMR